jgi:HAD superfamily hydrolase (TIGR01484 family)
MDRIVRHRTVIPVSEFHNRGIDVVLTDIDDTLTDGGKLGPEAYGALWTLHRAGVKVVPVTGRPAGWCELIARLWPVFAVVGENGAFYFLYDAGAKRMRRSFAAAEAEQGENRERLAAIGREILQRVPGTAIASDQFGRLYDLAIDYCEDTGPLDQRSVQMVREILEERGARAKVSSIHVNGWFGSYDKLQMARLLLQRELGLNDDAQRRSCAFVGDSPNDEPMFAFFPHSFGVANVRSFLSELHSKPAYVASKPGGLGFAEIAAALVPAG